MGAPKPPSFARMDVPPSRVFVMREGALHAEGVDLRALAEATGTPTWVYSARAVDAAYDAVDDAMRAASGGDHVIAYAIKANGNLALLRRLGARGCGADIVSGGELERVLRARIDPAKVVFSGVGKTRDELAAALSAGIKAIHVESASELRALAEVARDRGVVADFAFRVNPDVDAKTHPYIATGLHDTKFGLELDAARDLLAGVSSEPALRLIGVACHIGSQLETSAPLREAVAILARFGLELETAGFPLTHLDVGGGWPMEYGCEDAAFPGAEAFGAAIAGGLADAGAEARLTSAGGDWTLFTEPGRSLVGAAGLLLSRVVYVKDQGTKRFVIVDGAMSELIRPALYEAYHAVTPVVPREGKARVVDVVGPVCESGDFLALGRALPPVDEGDLVAVLGAGAYGREMSSAYNARPPAAEVLVDGDAWRVVRRRATPADLWALEEH